MKINSKLNLQIHSGSENSGSNTLFISMFTENYVNLANRLARSLKKHGLPFVIYQVPTVHYSISEKGSSDINYTKSSLIRDVMKRTNKNILYMDSDCVISKFPSLIFDIAGKIDFAIFNWLSNQNNNVYLPQSKDEINYKKYIFSHNIKPSCSNQLICSGAVQFWAYSDLSINLLDFWQYTIESNNGAADDHCLDFSFNNFFKLFNKNIRYYWLPKSYARYAWWIFDQPIIDHPQIPNITTKWNDVTDQNGRKRYYEDSFIIDPTKSINQYQGIIFPEDKIHILQNNNGEMIVEKITERIWITERNV